MSLSARVRKVIYKDVPESSGAEARATVFKALPNTAEVTTWHSNICDGTLKTLFPAGHTTQQLTVGEVKSDIHTRTSTPIFMCSHFSILT